MFTIILDMDDVICNLFYEWIERYNEEYCDNLTKGDFLEWEMSNVVKCGTKIYDYLADGSIYKLAAIYPGAYDITRKWLEKGYKIIVATRVHEPIAAMVKMEWMYENLPHLVHDMHIVTGNTKHCLRGNIIIDDAIHNLDTFVGNKIVFDQPWNQKCNYIRAWDWNDLDHLIYLCGKYQLHNMGLIEQLYGAYKREELRDSTP